MYNQGKARMEEWKAKGSPLNKVTDPVSKGVAMPHRRQGPTTPWQAHTGWHPPKAPVAIHSGDHMWGKDNTRHFEDWGHRV